MRAKGVEFDVTYINLREKPDWFLKISPHAKVPVLNVGDTPIAGAVKTIETLRAHNKRIFVATNAASYSRQQSVVKFQRMGFDFSEFEIVTSRMAAEQALSRHALDLWGVIASDAFAQSDLNLPCLRLTNQADAYDRVDGFLFLSTQEWSASLQLMLERSLAERHRPLIIANPDVIAPREVGFSTEPGYCGHRIAEQGVPSASATFHWPARHAVPQLARHPGHLAQSLRQ